SEEPERLISQARDILKRDLKIFKGASPNCTNHKHLYNCVNNTSLALEQLLTEALSPTLYPLGGRTSTRFTQKPERCDPIPAVINLAAGRYVSKCPAHSGEVHRAELGGIVAGVAPR